MFCIDVSKIITVTTSPFNEYQLHEGDAAEVYLNYSDIGLYLVIDEINEDDFCGTDEYGNRWQIKYDDITRLDPS